MHHGLCTLPDGVAVGPLNPVAFRELVADGQLSPETGILNHVTGETILVGELLAAIDKGEASPSAPPAPPPVEVHAGPPAQVKPPAGPGKAAEAVPPKRLRHVVKAASQDARRTTGIDRPGGAS